MKICSKCDQELPNVCFHKYKSGLQAWCKGCKAEAKRIYMSTERGKASQRKTYEKLRDDGYFRHYNHAKDLVKQTLRQFTNYYQKTGVIVQQPCSICGCDNTEKHHPDYEQKLLIVWLCHRCHMALHTKLKGE